MRKIKITKKKEKRKRKVEGPVWKPRNISSINTMLQWNSEGGRKIYSQGEKRKIERQGGKKIFTGERAANKRKTLNLKNLHPLAAAWKVKNPSFHLLCSRHLWKQKKRPPPSFGLGKANRREPHTKRGQLATLSLSGDQNQRNPWLKGVFDFWFLLPSAGQVFLSLT